MRVSSRPAPGRARGKRPCRDPLLLRRLAARNREIRDLKRAGGACARALDRSRRIFDVLADNVPALLSYVDTGQRYRYVNRRYGSYFGLRPEAIIGRTVDQLLGPQNYAVARPHLERALEGREVVYERTMSLPEGDFSMRVHYIPDMEPDGRVAGFFVVVNDVTELKAIEREIRRSNDRLRVIMEMAPEAIVTLNASGVVLGLNRAAKQQFGYAAEEVAGRSLGQLLAPPGGRDVATLLGPRGDSPGPVTGDRFVEVVGWHRDGTTFPAELRVSPLEGEEGLFVGIIRDMTERRALERDVARAATYEQERIGQEIHDGLGQALTAASMLATRVHRDLVRRDAPEAALVAQIESGLQRAMVDARALSRGLVPVPLVSDGLVAALEALAESTSTPGVVSCRFELQGISGVTEDDRMRVTQLYRIAQEAVHNAARHAGARLIRIRLAGSAGTPTLVVSDDGRGFDPEQDHDGLGLRIMRYRAGVVDYRLEIDSAPGAGTTLRATHVSVVGEWRGTAGA